MDFNYLIIGGVLIVLGFLVKRYPNLIAGYNTLPKKDKDKINIKRLSSLMRNMLIILGLLLAGGHCILIWAGWEDAQNIFTTVIIPTIVIITAIKAYKYF